MFIVMAVIIILGVLSFFLLRSGGTGGGTGSTPAKGHSSLQSQPSVPSNFMAFRCNPHPSLTSSVPRIAS